MNRKADIGWGTVVFIVLGILVAGLSLPIIKYIKYAGDVSDENMIKEYNVNPADDFVPYDYQAQMNNEEKIVAGSVNALIESLKSLAAGDELNNYKNNLVNTNIKSVRITYTSNIDIIDESLSEFRNQFPTWTFTKKIDLGSEIPSMREIWIESDYELNWCSDSAEKQCLSAYDTSYVFKNTCQCDGMPLEPYGADFEDLPDRVKKAAKEKNLGMVKQLRKVKTFNIEVNYRDGKSCFASIPDTDSDLLAWGQLEDRNGNGIKGSYKKGTEIDSDVNKKITEVLTEDQIKHLSPEQLKLYFPNKEITSESGEGCLDSPTFIQCNGVRVYYCGKLGGVPEGQFKQSYYYQFDNKEEIHSLAGAKFLIAVNDKEFKDTESSVLAKYSKNIVTDDGNTYLKGDLAFYLAMGPYSVPYYFGKMLFSTQTNDPKVMCYGGETSGNTKYKCEGNSCSVCSFELPQNITKDYNLASQFIAGAGDPQYILYYESFPIGEEEAWTMNVESVALASLVVEDALFAGVAGGVAKVAKLAGKIASKIPFVSKVFKSSSSIIIKPLLEGGEKVIIKALANNPKLLGRIATMNTFTKGKYLEAVAQKADELVNDDSLNLLVKEIEKNPVLSNEFAKFSEEAFKSLGIRIGDRGLKYTVAFWVGSMAHENDILNQKFKPVGINNIALKYSAADPIIYENDVVTEDKLSHYYIALVKDRYKGHLTNAVFGQEAQRFYLASPCKADLKIYRTNCACKTPNEGFVYLDQDTYELSENPLKDGNWIPVAKSSVNMETGDVESAVKLCQPYETKSGTYQFDPLVNKASCILVDPIIQDDTFCYGGKDISGAIGYAGVALNMASSVGLSVAFPGLGTIASFFTSTAIDAATAFATNWAQKTQKWPNH